MNFSPLTYLKSTNCRRTVALTLSQANHLLVPASYVTHRHERAMDPLLFRWNIWQSQHSPRAYSFILLPVPVSRLFDDHWMWAHQLQSFLTESCEQRANQLLWLNWRSGTAHRLYWQHLYSLLYCNEICDSPYCFLFFFLKQYVSVCTFTQSCGIVVKRKKPKGNVWVGKFCTTKI